MATAYTSANIGHMNVKQLRKIAKDVAVNPVTINTVLSQNNSKTALISAIKAK